ncbi:MAG: hypothetical protein H0V70_27810 [Ktedonobacteraceae bacterium]|nr:hypothetical protein [Ktedonobacteraceae bacterium]
MKGFRKSTRIAYWVLRALAISSALLLFSIIGIVALQPASHATGLVITVPPTTGATSSPADMTTPTATTGVTPTVPPPTNTPVPTIPPTQTPPTATPIPAPTKAPAPTPTTAPPMNTPVVPPTATVAALGPAGPLPTPPLKGTPKATPSPTPSSSPTASPGTTPIPASTNGNAGSSSNTPQNANSGTKAALNPLVVPIAGVSATILLGSAGLLGFMVWKRRKVVPAATPAFAQASGGWAQASASTQAIELAPAQNRPMSPFAMQGIVQYSPLLGAPNTSQLDAPAPPPASDFRPLTIDYPQIMEVHTDKTPALVTPGELHSLSPRSAEFQPALALASAQDSSPTPGEINPASSSIRTPRMQEQQNAPIAYQFPQQDPLLENIMQQVQMGIFALPGKEA